MRRPNPESHLRQVSASAVAALLAWLACVGVATAATRAHLVGVSTLASSPSAVRRGELWRLVTSGLLVQRPLLASLLALAALAALALIYCGPRALAVSAVSGHIGSTLLAYTLLAGARVIDPTRETGALVRPDYGVSAITAAWLGSVAAVSWRRRGQTAGGRARIVLACASVALVAWMLRRGLTILDSDHVFAFVIGVAAVTWNRATRFATPAPAAA